MTMILKTFRIEKRNLRRRRRGKTMSVPRVHQMKIPHYDEILLLTEEQARKVGVNTNQAVRALNTTLIKKSNPLKKKLYGTYSVFARNFTISERRFTIWWQRITATEQEHINGTANGMNFHSPSFVRNENGEIFKSFGDINLVKKRTFS